MFHAGRSLLGVQFRDFGSFPAPRRGYARLFACAANESAKRFAGDVEAGVGEPLPDLFVRLSRAQRPSISNKREQRRAVFVVGGSAASFSKVSR